MLCDDTRRAENVGTGDRQVDFTGTNRLRSVKIDTDRNLLTRLRDLRRERKLRDFAAIALARVGSARVKVDAQVNRIRVCFREERSEGNKSDGVAQSRANAGIQPKIKIGLYE